MEKFMSLDELQNRIRNMFPGEWMGKVETWDALSRQQPSEILYKLKHNGFIPFLYEMRKTKDVLSGHWMVAIDRGNAVEVFDSHGSKINPLDWYKDKTILNHVDGSAMSAEKLEPILSNKLFNSGYEFVDWNNKELQAKKPGIATCGKWVLFRLLYHKLFPEKDIDDFVDFVFKLGKKIKMTNDEMVNELFTGF